MPSRIDLLQLMARSKFARSRNLSLNSLGFIDIFSDDEPRTYIRSSVGRRKRSSNVFGQGNYLSVLVQCCVDSFAKVTEYIKDPKKMLLG